MSQYSFPLLGAAEIIPCLAEFDLPLEEHQLQKPTFDAMKTVYESVVFVLVGVSREELQQPVFSAIDVLEFPELHDESIPCLALLHHINKLMVAAGVKDFGLKDLYKPDPQRTRRNLSAIINFAKFREEKLGAYTQLQEHIESALQEREQLEAENLQMTNELKRLQAERAAEEPEVAALQKELDEYTKTVQELNQRQSELQAEVRMHKQTGNELADKQAEMKFALLSERQQAEKLAEQIVQSPERLQRSVEGIQSSVDRERALVAASERRTRDLYTRIDMVIKVEKELSKTAAAMETLSVEVQKKKQASRAVKEARAQVAQNENELQHLATTTQHHRRQAAAYQDRIRRVEAQGKLKCEAAASSVEERRKDMQARQAEAIAAQAKVSENEALARSIKQQHSSVRAAHSSQVAAVKDRYGSLLADVTNYNRSLVHTMQPDDVLMDDIQE